MKGEGTLLQQGQDIRVLIKLQLLRELMAGKTKLAELTLEPSQALQEYLDHEHQLHLQMIKEQKQLEDLRKQKIQDQLEEEERRRKIEEQEIA